MARKLADVLHLFLDDAPPPPGGGEAPWLGRVLARLDPPLEWVAEGPSTPGLQRSGLARGPDGRTVAVLVAGSSPADGELLTLGLARLEQLTRQATTPSGPPVGGRGGHPPGLILIADGFSEAVRGAAALLGPDRVRLVHRISG